MSNIQDNVNKIFEEKERQNLVDSIVGQRVHAFEMVLENQKNNKFTEEEINYINSIYYF